MTTFKIGDKVRASTHPREAVDGSVPPQPGATGIVCGVGVDTVRVRHDDGSRPWYRADDLIAIREVARAAGEKTELELRVTELEAASDRVSLGMERRRLGIEQLAGMTLNQLVGPLKCRGEEWDPALHASEEADRVTRLEQQLNTFRDAMARELQEYDQRLAALDPDDPREEAPPVADQQPVDAREALTRSWRELTPVQRDTVRRWMVDVLASPSLPPRSHRVAAESALTAIPGLLSEIEGLRSRQEDIIRGRDIALRELASSPPASIVQAYEGLHRVARAVAATSGTYSLDALHDALQTLAELGVTPGEPDPTKAPEPDDAAPEAAETIRLLQGRVEELEQSVAARGDRSPEWVEGAERMLNRLAHEMRTRGLWKAAVERATELQKLRRRICQTLHVEPGDVTDEQIGDLVRGRLEATRLVEDLGIDGLNSAIGALSELGRYSELSMEELTERLRQLAGDGDGDGECPAQLLADHCEVLLRAAVAERGESS